MLSFNNTNIDLQRRVVMERYYDFLYANEKIYTENGCTVGSHNIRYVDYINDEYSTQETAIRQKNTIEKLDVLINIIRSTMQGRTKFKSDKDIIYTIMDIDYSEINCSNFFDTNTYKYFFIMAITYRIYEGDFMGADGYDFVVPFIIVNEDGDDKFLVYPRANRIAKYDVDESDDVMTFPITPDSLGDIFKKVWDEMAGNDIELTKIFSYYKADTYQIRKYDSDSLVKVVNTFSFDPRLISKTDIDDSAPVTDCMLREAIEIPIIDLTSREVLVTDNVKFFRVKLEDYISNRGDRFLIVARPFKRKGDFFVNKLGSGVAEDELPLGMNHLSFSESVKYEDGNLKTYYESHIIGEKIENGFIYMTPNISNLVNAYGEAKITDSILKNLSSISDVAVESYKKVIKTGKGLLKAIKNTVDDVSYYGYVNNFIDNALDTLQTIAPFAALSLLGAPIIGMVYSVIVAIYKINQNKAENENEAIKKVEDNFRKRIDELREKASKYKEDGNVKAAQRLNKNADDLEKKLDNIAKVRAGEEI